MKHSKALAGVAAALFFLLMVFDSRTALAGAAQGAQLCVATVVPSLFPFFLVSILLTSQLSGRKIPFFAPVGRALGIPEGAESIFLVGLLGGYPVGAQAVAQACKAGCLSRREGEGLLAFCSNAGPAFLFGIGATLFPEIWVCWLLWAIHIAAALAVALMTPRQTVGRARPMTAVSISLPQAMQSAIRSMALVCGWIVLFRTVLAFAQRWFLWLLPSNLQLLFAGLLELANGCCDLAQVSDLGLRMQMFSVFLGFGGACVVLQTKSVLLESGLTGRAYLPGKLAQGAISYLLCLLCQCFLPAQMQCFHSLTPALVAGAVCLGYGIYGAKIKKDSGNLLSAGV